MKSSGPNDRVFVLEIGGKPILAFVATTLREAMELSRESWLRDDFRVIESGGDPVWDGKAKITVRSAEPDEVSEYKGRTDELALADELGMLYLIELDGSE